MDLKQYKDIFVLCEQRDGIIMNVTYELLGAARELSVLNSERVAAVLIGSNVKQYAAKLIEHGADVVYVCDAPAFKDYATEPYTAAVTHVIEKYKPSVMLIGASALGRDVAPRVSARVGTGLTADCTSLEMKPDGLYMTRPAFGGNLFATIVCPDHRPQMSTVRPGVMKKPEPDAKRRGDIVEVKVDVPANRAVMVSEKKEKQTADKIELAKTLVSVGRGVGKDGLEAARELAKSLDATIASSRAMVDAGHTTSDRQVGQTGKTVRPECYIALGISGAVQHLAGMEESEYIIAVNKDKDANIFGTADLCVVGDVHKIMPLLTKEIQKAKAE